MSSSAVRAGQAFVEVGLKSKIKEGVRQIQNQLSAVSSSLQSFGTGLAAAGATAGAAFGGVLAAVGGAALSFADSGSALADMSARTGVSAQALSALGYAAKQSGSSIDEVEGALRKMQQGIGQAVGGSKSAIDKFEALGLSVDSLSKLSPDQQFAAISKAIAQIDDPTLRASSAMEVFGKSATRILPLITSDVGALISEANQLGLVLSAEDVDAADKLGDSLDKLKSAFGAAYNAIGAAVAGPLTALAEITSSIVSAIGGFINSNRTLSVAIAAVATAGTAVGAALLTVGGVLVGLGAAIGGVVVAWPAIVAGFAAVSAAAGPVLSVLGAIAAAAASVTVLGGSFAYLANRAGILKPAFDSVMQVLGQISSTVGQTFGGITSALASGNIMQAVKTLWAGVKVAFFSGAKAAYDSFVWLFNNAGSLLYKFAEAVANTLNDIFSMIPKLIQAALSGAGSITEMISQALQGKLGPALDEQIKKAQSELNALTADGQAKSIEQPGKSSDSSAPQANIDEEQKQAYDDRIQALRDEIATMELGADAAELLKLKQQGLNDEQLAAIQQLQQQRAAIAANKKAQEEAQRKAEDAKKQAEDDRKALVDRGKQMAEEVRTPFEVLQSKLAEIAKLESGGFINSNTASRQRELALSELHQPMREAIKSGRNNIAEANTQAAMDIVIRNQRTFGMGVMTNKKNPLEDYAREQRDFLKIIADQTASGPTINVTTRRI